MKSLISKYARFTMKALSFCVIAAALVLFSGWASERNEADAQVREQMIAAERAASRGSYPVDGTFTGSAQGYGGLVTTAVTIENGYIDHVDLVDASSEDDAWLDMAIVLLDRIPEAQTTAIDTVSGATFTSAGILNSATYALQSAESSGEGGSDGR